MRVRSGKLRAGEGFLCTIVVKPPLARLETRDDRVTRSGEMFRCMLTWRTVTTADVTALRASAQMKPPSARAGAFDATRSARLDCRVDTIPFRLHGLLSDFSLLQLLRIDAVFGSKLIRRYRGAAQVMARLTLGEPPRGRHGGFVFVS
jgi:hypothetical protein